MENFENKLKERFQDYGFFRKIDSDELWDQLSGNIDLKTKPSKKYRSSFLLMLLVLVIGTLGILEYCGISQFIDSKSFEGTATTKEIIFEDSANNNMKFSKVVNHSNVEAQTKVESPVENLVEVNSVVATYKKIENGFHIENHFNEILFKNNKANLSASITKTDLLKSNQTTNEVVSKKQLAKPQSQNDLILPRKKLARKDLFKDRSLERLPSLGIESLDYNYSEEFTKLNPVFAASEEKNQLLNKNKKLSIGFFAGVHNLKYHLKGNSQSEVILASTMQQTLSEKAGQNASIELGWKLNKSLKVISGFNYSNSQIVFDYVKQWDTLMVHNLMAGAPLIPTEAKRTIKHHNSMAYMSIPLLISGEFTFSKVSIGSNAGLGLNFILRQQGRYLDSNLNVKDIENSDSISPLSNFYLDYRFQPHLNYNISDRLWLQLKGDFRFSTTNFSDLFGLNYSLRSKGLSLGLIYRY